MHVRTVCGGIYILSPVQVLSTKSEDFSGQLRSFSGWQMEKLPQLKFICEEHKHKIKQYQHNLFNLQSTFTNLMRSD